MATRRRRGPGVYAAEAVIMTLIVGLIFLGAFVGWIVGHYATPGHTKTVTVAAGAQKAVAEKDDTAGAAAFSASQLNAQPTDDWITNGGSLSNDRYSPLDEINASNIKNLKGVWHIHLNSA